MGYHQTVRLGSFDRLKAEAGVRCHLLKRHVYAHLEGRETIKRQPFLLASLASGQVRTKGLNTLDLSGHLKGQSSNRAKGISGFLLRQNGSLCGFPTLKLLDQFQSPVFISRSTGRASAVAIIWSSIDFRHLADDQAICRPSTVAMAASKPSSFCFYRVCS